MKQIKRVFIVLLALILVLSLAACGKPAQETTETTQAVPLTDEQILQQRRELVVDKMRQMQSILWRSDADFRYTFKNGSAGVEFDEQDKIVEIVKGRLYQGIPYTHGTGSLEAFLNFSTSIDDKGIYTLSGLNEEILSGDSDSAYTPRVGNDCADAVYWAWAQISPTIRFTITTYMSEAYGCVKVGDYDCDPKKLTQTAQVCLENGEQRMYEAYAKLQPGDAVVYSVSSGHAMMVSEVKTVRRDDGTINRLKSYVKVIDQTSGAIGNEKYYYDETLKENVYYCGNVDMIVPFSSLFEQGYLPVTCKELVDPSPLVKAEVTGPERALSPDNMFDGTVESNYRISHVTVTITDSQKKAVQQATCFGRDSEMFSFNLYRFTWEDPAVMQGSIDLNTLPEGSYQCTYTCQISTGEIFTIASFELKK